MPLQTFKKVILGGPRGAQQKNFKIWTQRIMARIIVRLRSFYKDAVLVMGCYWCWFGGMQDRYDPILPPVLIVRI